MKILKILIVVLMLSTNFVNVFATDKKTAEKEVAELKQKLDKVNDEIEVFNKEIKAFETDIKKLETDNNALKKQSEELSNDIFNMERNSDLGLIMLQSVTNDNLIINSVMSDDKSYAQISTVNNMIQSSITNVVVFQESKKKLDSNVLNIEQNIKKIQTSKGETEKKKKEVEKTAKASQDEIDKLNQILAKDDSSKSTKRSSSSSSSGGNGGVSSSGLISKSDKIAYMSEAGIAESDYSYVDDILTKESGWNYKAVNPSSGAYGLCQSLPPGKMSSAGSDYLTNPSTQLRWCASYAKERYGSWQNAHNFWLANRWW